MRQKTFGKWLAAAGILIVMTIWMVLPALAAPTVNSVRITFKDKYEDPGVIEEPEISCSSYGIEITSVEWSKDVEKGILNESDGNADLSSCGRGVSPPATVQSPADLRCYVE